VTAPPHDPEREEVVALETDPDGSYPFRVWVADDSSKEEFPYYARAVEFCEDEWPTGGGGA